MGDAQTAIDNYEWTTEQYLPDGPTDLGQYFFDSGLIFLVNQAVLHNYGYALGVTVDDDGETVLGVNLHKTSDPDGIWFDEDTIVAGRQKLREAGLIGETG